MAWTRQQIEARKLRKKNRKTYLKANPKVRDYRLYVLLLEGDNYYVGLTAYKDVKIRYQQHVDGLGARWTALYKPIRIIETKEIGILRESDACLLETELTLYYIEKYGVSKVRGGSICSVDETKAYHHYDRAFAKVNRKKMTPPEKRIADIDKIIKNLTEERAKLVASILP